eukprot:TRINITY_DN1812_c0_g2_i1.p1 TRINITY_DN1812_c0_g2~~TRINITY_DN1812_c0_g2_i1.p1  ORF type:complete len:230 (+),score=38.86 TRINITY_DN1812_c0_g2_i1:132-821(+)
MGESKPEVKAIAFDLDNTLYSKKTGLADEVSSRIGMYMKTKLHIPKEDIESMRQQYYQKYGITLNGLLSHYTVDIKDYLDFIHGGLDLPAFLKPDPLLRQMIQNIKEPITKWIFSNADEGHCQRVLKVLGVEGCFNGMLEYLAMKERCKPHPDSYKMLLEMIPNSDGAEKIAYENVLFLDDSLGNLVGAKKLGMQTVLVGSTDRSVDYCIDLITDLPTVMPWLFEETKL